ncbi:PadR family transcriptional regulator [Gulosibacter faecalis]|jgi:DNA-binding PadR family transcriptional regulator|uniref:Helix-turn-helix transcriptional regulator n=1 Tax=Gulosibacter faecalis TaxID=272240 RepID=A0ABW5UVX3_9MICO|nr:PadR family transcriptional regulator [Gulosibacter faecalis]
MRFVLLGLLLQRPCSAYELRKQFTTGISLFYSASLGSIQRALEVLEAKGLVEKHRSTDTGRPKNLYVITGPGREAWREWMRSPITESDVEQVTLAKIYLLGSMPREEQEGVLTVIRGRVTTDLERLVRLREEIHATTVPEQHRQTAHYRLATLDYGVRAHELMADWLDELRTS